MAKRVNLNNGKVLTEVPLEVKRKLYEEAEKKAMTIPVFLKVMLLDWYETEMAKNE